jgi:hypothetical protein
MQGTVGDIFHHASFYRWDIHLSYINVVFDSRCSVCGSVIRVLRSNSTILKGYTMFERIKRMFHRKDSAISKHRIEPYIGDVTTPWFSHGGLNRGNLCQRIITI